ncbi:MAG: DUF1573 domain-containing protein [Bacteroidia bacterium]|nr:DUF1573 domain-containing protein [Bacteroidia bacterium]
MRSALLFLLIAFAPVFHCRGFSQTAPGATLAFTDSKKNFGFVKEGEVVTLEYEFKNTGGAPIIITEIKVTCGCTTTEFPKEPVLPGQKGKIKVKFDTKNKFDRQDRTIQVISNATGSPHELRFKGVVLKNKSGK